MAVSPVTAISTSLQNTFVTKICKSMMDASIQLSKLNVTASIELMQASATAARKTMELRTVWDTPALILEQSKLSFDWLRSYSQRAQEIVATSQNADNTDTAAKESTSQQAAQSKEQDTHDDVEGKQAKPHKQQHEVDPHPSLLVEKLISSVATDAGGHS